MKGRVPILVGEAGDDALMGEIAIESEATKAIDTRARARFDSKSQGRKGKAVSDAKRACQRERGSADNNWIAMKRVATKAISTRASGRLCPKNRRKGKTMSALTHSSCGQGHRAVANHALDSRSVE